MKPGFYLPCIRVKLKLFSPFCSLCVIFVILIRIYRMGEFVHARERARKASPVIKKKPGFGYPLFYSCRTLTGRPHKNPPMGSRSACLNAVCRKPAAVITEKKRVLAIHLQSYSVYVIPVQSRPVLVLEVQSLLEVVVVLPYQDSL